MSSWRWFLSSGLVAPEVSLVEDQITGKLGAGKNDGSVRSERLIGRFGDTEMRVLIEAEIDGTQSRRAEVWPLAKQRAVEVQIPADPAAFQAEPTFHGAIRESRITADPHVDRCDQKFLLRVVVRHKTFDLGAGTVKLAANAAVGQVDPTLKQGAA